MRRREFITLLGGAAPLGRSRRVRSRSSGCGVSACSWPLSENDPMAQARVAAFQQALAQLGWTGERNLKIEWRWTGGDIRSRREYAAELAAPGAGGHPRPKHAERCGVKGKQPRAIPIVFAVVNDPVAQGFIASMAQPRRQYHRLFLPRLFDGREIAGAAQADRAKRRSRRRHVHPGHVSPTTTSICNRSRRSHGHCPLG